MIMFCLQHQEEETPSSESPLIIFTIEPRFKALPEGNDIAPDDSQDIEHLKYLFESF